MRNKTLLWHNLWKRPIEKAVEEASARHLERLGTPPTHVILPLGEWPAEVGGLKVETDKRVSHNYMQVYDGGEK